MKKRANPRKSDILREVRSRTGLAGSQRVCCFHFSCCKPRDHFGLVKTRRQATKVTKQHVQRFPGSFVVEQRNSSLKRFSKLTCERQFQVLNTTPLWRLAKPQVRFRHRSERTRFLRGNRVVLPVLQRRNSLLVSNETKRAVVKSECSFESPADTVDLFHVTAFEMSVFRLFQVVFTQNQ